MNGPCVALAVSGTGGHLFPGLALAEEIRRRRPDARILFFSSGRPLETEVLGSLGFDRVDLPRIERPSGVRGAAALATGLPRAAIRASRAMKRERVRAFVGLGGGSTLIPALAAWRRGIPVGLLEQNARPGWTTRMLSRLAAWVVTQWPDTESAFPRPSRVHADGNPLRNAILEGVRADPASLGLLPGRRTILVLGGSQGARGLNLMVEEALPDLASCAGSLQFFHVSGGSDLERVRKAYGAAGLRAIVAAFRTDMASLYAASDLVVTRAGGTTLAEIAFFGRPAILVPFPAAADDHQTENARRFAALGGADVVTQAPGAGARLATLVKEALDDSDGLERRARASRGFHRPDARARIADRILAAVA